MIAALLAMSHPVGASIPKEIFSKWQRDAQQKQMTSFKSVFVNFWEKEFRYYHLHGRIRQLIGQIDNQEMLAFLAHREVKPTRADLVTSDNLVAYFRHKHLGTEADYAWIDLMKGEPAFVTAVRDWQTIQKEHGFEFVPTYHVLHNAKLVTKKDAEVWSDIFRMTFKALPETDQDAKVLLLLSLMPHVWGDLNLVEPSAPERFAFLAEELKTQTANTNLFSQALVLNLYGINFSSKLYAEAAELGRMLRPKTTSLLFTFQAQALANDLSEARATLTDMEALRPQDEQMLHTCREVIRELEKMKKESNKSVESVCSESTINFKKDEKADR